MSTTCTSTLHHHTITAGSHHQSQTLVGLRLVGGGRTRCRLSRNLSSAVSRSYSFAPCSTISAADCLVTYANIIVVSKHIQLVGIAHLEVLQLGCVRARVGVIYCVVLNGLFVCPHGATAGQTLTLCLPGKLHVLIQHFGNFVELFHCTAIGGVQIFRFQRNSGLRGHHLPFQPDEAISTVNTTGFLPVRSMSEIQLDVFLSQCCLKCSPMGRSCEHSSGGAPGRVHLFIPLNKPIQDICN